MKFELEVFIRNYIFPIIAILASFLISATILVMLLSHDKITFLMFWVSLWTPPALVACALIILSYVSYQCTRRQLLYFFSACFTILGVVLILMGAVVPLPYSAGWETYLQEVSTDLTKNLWYPTSAYPVNNHDYRPLSGDYVNDSLRITIQPFETKAYSFWFGDYVSWGSESDADYRNFPPYIPTIQIDVGTYEDLNFTLLAFKDKHFETLEVAKVLVNTRVSATWYLQPGWHERAIYETKRVHFFWTPTVTGSQVYNDIGFTFENPSNLTFTFSFKVTKIQARDGYRTVTKSKPPLEVEYAYAGLCLVSATFILDSYIIVKRMRKKSIA